MKDPFVALKNTLQPIFQITPMKNGSYIYPEVQLLKYALDNFQLNNKRKLIELLKTLRAALPYIEKGKIDCGVVKTQADSITKALNLPLMQWDKYSNTSPRFQFSANHNSPDTELLPWLEQESGTPIKYDDPNSLINKLLEHSECIGFSQKLSAHLKKEPNFLVKLIMESKESFVQIIQTRLVLYLTDPQLAQAIIKHIHHFEQNHQNLMTKSAHFIDKLNELLSNGRSIPTLLRNTEAKLILDSSELIKTYQEELHDASKNSPSSLEEGERKLTL